MADTYTLIQKITVSQATPSVTFSNIPQGYTDLVIHQSAMSDVTTALGGNYNIEFNGVTSGYSGKRLYADPSGGASSDSGTSKWSGFIPGSGATQNVPNSCFIYIPNYSSNNHKSWSVEVALENNNTNSYLGLGSNLWSNTAAITSITLKDIASSIYTGNFLPNSTFYLYGVTKSGVSTPTTAAAYATGGDSITTDGTYWIHTFRSSGTFTPKKALSNVDYLVVAGGGGGGSRIAGGGGAGGLRCTVTATGGGGSLESALSLTTQAYTVTVGAGGAGGVSMNSGNGQIGTQGSNSVFSSITSTGGGGGGAYNGLNATNGGSGGGNGSPDGGSTRGLGTANQGYNGGASITNQEGGGGGGAGAVGGAGSSGNGGNGGAGLATSISGTSTTYAGGGGGAATSTAGSGGSGGGGAGANGNNNATSGTANTGSGGGGARNSGDITNVSGGQGGSGVVIVRYPV